MGAMEPQGEKTNQCNTVEENTFRLQSPPPFDSFDMPRVSRRARTAHWRLTLVNGQFHTLDSYEPTLPYACPYCDHPSETASDRNRHIMLRPYCRSRHMHTLETGREARREREYKLPGPSSRPHPLYDRDREGVAYDTNGVPLRYNDPRRWTDNGRTCWQPAVERFPAGTAGSPISDDRACPRDLKTYIELCGNLAKPVYMEAAELLMTTGLSSVGRTKNLKSSFYKGKAPAWTNDQRMLIDIDKLPHGPVS
ncbi:hypothetical protein FS749_015995 [Ceratobasidium sp. UAMH 11750]|nr:hypothetical protein FS749_015995 [Ceratobasidium sp. UAMH 11750]